MTYRDAIIESWIAAGVSPELIRLNPEAIDHEAEQELRLWIERFISSFRKGQLQTALRERVFFRRCPALFWNGHGRSLSGIALALKPNSDKDCRFLLSKRKQLAYRIRQLDPEVALLSIFEPQATKALTTVLATGEVIFSEAKGELR